MITEKRSKAIQELIKELIRVEPMGSPELADFDDGWGVLISEETARELWDIYQENIRYNEELIQLRQEANELKLTQI
jgi:hypothetical protein